VTPSAARIHRVDIATCVISVTMRALEVNTTGTLVAHVVRCLVLTNSGLSLVVDVSVLKESTRECRLRMHQSR
jgi:hypothetical protein